MIRRQTPACAILMRAQAVYGAQMPAKRAAPKPALKAHDELRRDRAADRHGRPALFLPSCRPLATCKRSIDIGNQSRQIVGCDGVMSNIAADDLRDQMEINLTRRIVAFHVLPSGPYFNWP